jgi:hypothetical protein
MWIYLADTDAVETFRCAARDAGVDVLACPAVAIEMLNYGDARVRKRRLQAITRGSWTRLMPEAHTTSQELVDAVRALRPHWLRNPPDLTEWYALCADWRGNWWTRMRRRAGGELEAIASLGGPERLASARTAAKAERQAMSELGVQLDQFHPDHQLARIPIPLAGHDGSPVARWRADGLFTWTAALQGERLLLPYLEWTRGWLADDVASHDNADWVAFWTRDVDAVRLPRWVTRIDLAILQTASRYSKGTPGDNQIGPYLLDADIFATADKPFAAVLRRLAETTSLGPLPAIH